MRALSLTQPGKLDLITCPEPASEPDDVLLKIRRVGICGTDVHAFRGHQPYFTYPRIPGHELAATVEVPGSSGLQTNEWVTVIPYRHCGRCLACQNGQTNCCSSMKVYGVHTDGGMAERLSVPKDLIYSVAGLSPRALATLEPLAIGTHAVARASVSAGETVVVMGLGPIGIGVAAAAEQRGARVLAVESSQARCDWATRHLPDVTVIPSGTADCIAAVRDFTGGDFASVVFEATGNLNVLESTLPLLGHGGSIVLVGLQAQPFRFLHPEFHKRETTLMSSRNATRIDFDAAARLITDGAFPIDAYAASEISFEDMPGMMHNISASGPVASVIKHHVLIG